MNSEKSSDWSRLPGDFLAPSTAEKAGIIEVRLGTSAPVPYIPEKASFAWPRSSPVTSLENDSRKAGPGSLYFALPGLHVDGHDFIHHAINQGAAAVVHEKELTAYREGVLYIRVKDSRCAMSSITDAFYNFPSRRMGVIGVTGTEGKSTTVYLIYQLLKLLNKKTGFISTVQQGDGETESWNSEHRTTPEAVTIHRLLADMCRNNAEFAVVEASSHGLSKKTMRLGDVDFDVGVMTKVTHEHLEFHGTWEQYRSDKAELFRALDTSPSSHRKQCLAGEFSVPSFGVVNADDPSADFFAAATMHKTYRFSTGGAEADLSLRLIESGPYGNWYEVFINATGSTLIIRDQLPGAFNAANVLAALLVVSNLLSLGIEDLAPLVPHLKPVPGRMTAIHRGQPFEVLVDFAHTPSAFESVLSPLQEWLKSTKGRIISLFGSPGERDTQKRSLQGEIAARYSDIVILTNDDPRGEDPMTILEEIAKGCFAAQGCETTKDCEAVQGCEAAQGCETVQGRARMIRDETLFLIPNRPEAIRKAISLARKGDLVLLLGKGHENFFIGAGGEIAYDEVKEAEAALEEAGFGK